MFAKLAKYLKEAREEFNKVTWPNRKTTINLSILVVVISVVVAIIIGAFDYILNIGLEKALEAQPSTITTPVDPNSFNFSPDINVTGTDGSPIDVNVTPAN